VRAVAQQMSNANQNRIAPFSEKGFYLNELRDRTLAIAAPSQLLDSAAPIEPVLKDLEANRTRVILISDRAAVLEPLAGLPALSAQDLDTLAGRVWRTLGHNLRVGIVADDQRSFGASCRQIVLALGIRKLVWVDAAGGLIRTDGARDSFVDSEALRERIAEVEPDCRSSEILVHVEAMLSAGVDAVNLCALDGVADELFTYAGSGTLFTREGYVSVRALGLDDFDAAADLIERGIAEGYLAPRTPEQVERILDSAFGAFIGGNHLAGLGALLPYREARAAEIASLYTLTRFVGEGVGTHLVRFAAQRAVGQGCRYVFSCTTSPRVVAFFERHGFRRAADDELPREKWRDYDPTRRARLTCLRRDL
jgi:N-acetylglutamate synthase-like GNAT family acetyltransferase